jgi:hypothetical protein
LHELEYEEAMATEFEIMDLDPQQKGSLTVNRWLDGQRFSFRTRLGMALFTVFGVALFSLLLVSPLNLTGASHLEQASNGHISTPSSHAQLHSVQMLVVHQVTYVIDQDGVVRALWTRHKYMYVLWQYSVAPSSHLLRVDHDVVYLASPGRRLVALRASDGAVLWTKKGT